MASTAPRPSTIRIGAVRYLNAWPLTFYLDRFAPAAEVVVDFPSRLADGLAHGQLDVGLISSIEYSRNPGCTIVSDACIASDGEVRSVKLHSRVPLERIGSLALDEGSRTSAALVQIWLKERMGLTPELRPLPIGALPADCQADAVMLIGDRGMRPAGGEFTFAWDLGEEWTRWTGLPFVFALWVARPGVELDDLGHVAGCGPRRGPGPAARDRPLLSGPCLVRKVNIGLSGSGINESILSWVFLSVHLGGAFNTEIVEKPCGFVFINSNSTISPLRWDK